MDADTIITALIGIAGVGGAFFSGKRLGNQQIQTTAVNTVQLLQAAVAELKDQNAQKDQKIAELGARVEVLEGLVTQRAAVAQVHATVTRIAEKLGA